MHSVNLLAFPLFDRVQRFFNGPHSLAEKHDVSFTLMIPTMPPKPSYAPLRSLHAPKHIPNEIVLRILEAAHDPHDIASTNELLMNSALVCRDWSVLAQKLLFHHVTLRSQAGFYSLANALSPSTSRGTMLADAVIHFRVIIDHNQPNFVSSQSFAHIVELCPRLRALDISLFGRGAPGHDVVGSPTQARMQRSTPSFDEHTLATLRARSSITRLCLSNWTDNESAMSQLLHLWPALQKLEIKGTTPVIPSHTSSPFPCALHELRINCQRPPSFEFLRWLLQNSQGSLRAVTADRESCSEVLARVVGDHHDTLETVILPACQTREAASSLMQCTGLRHLRIEDARVAMVLCRTLPSTLQHVALGVHRDTDMQPVLQLIFQKTGLESITFHLWKGGECQAQLDTVRIACALQGIQMKITNHIVEFRSDVS